VGRSGKDTGVAQYLVLLYEDEVSWAQTGPAEAADRHAAHEAFKARHRSVVRGGNALRPTATATSLRSDGAGGVTVTDGAFAETKEALGGYYLIDVADLDEALAVAGQVPARFGGVEVRPVKVVG